MFFRRIVSACVLVSFLLMMVMPVRNAGAESLVLPQPGAMVHLSQPYIPVMIKGLKVHPENPLLFDFILDTGNDKLQAQSPKLREEADKLIRYFLAALTIPEKELWVNLSPYEKDRIISKNFGVTALGRDLLGQDYILKQLTSTMLSPKEQLGADFWKRMYKQVSQKYGTTNVPIDTFNKIWIVPSKAVIYQHGNDAYVAENHLKVLLEVDYLALSKHRGQPGDMFKSELQRTCPQAGCQASKPLNVKAPQVNNQPPSEPASSLGTQIIREIMIPEIEKEVNQGANFIPLRQMANAVVLAYWYKKTLKDSILGQVYADKDKTNGIELQDKQEKNRIYAQYLKALKKGVVNYISEEYDANSNQVIPRKYFTGGCSLAYDKATTIEDHAMSAGSLLDNFLITVKLGATKILDKVRGIKKLPKSLSMYKGLIDFWNNNKILNRYDVEMKGRNWEEVRDKLIKDGLAKWINDSQIEIIGTWDANNEFMQMISEILHTRLENIGALTGGGLATGHNHLFYYLLRTVHTLNETLGLNIKITGISKGWRGLWEPNEMKKARQLLYDEISRWAKEGGSIFGTSRTNPVGLSFKELNTELEKLGYRAFSESFALSVDEFMIMDRNKFPNSKIGKKVLGELIKAGIIQDIYKNEVLINHLLFEDDKKDPKKPDAKVKSAEEKKVDIKALIKKAGGDDTEIWNILEQIKVEATIRSFPIETIRSIPLVISRT